jgi:predicted GNAT family acetyltransferase
MMTPPNIQHELDNPFWSCLATRHAHIALGGSHARRYPADISPIAGLPDVMPANVAALEALVNVGEDIGVAGPFVPTLPGNWETLYESRITQMIRPVTSSLPEGDVGVSILGAADVPEMLALVELTKPGPFRPRTIELGTYIGIRDGGHLVAMAGERTWVGNYREVSAVCTHPDARGRGYARALMSRVINRMLCSGQTPFLHVESINLLAIDIYLGLGFIRRTAYPLLAAKRIG